MNEFEKLLPGKCPQYMILLLAKNYENETSQEFKDYVAKHFNRLQTKEALLMMPIREFFDLYAKAEKQSMKTHLLSVFYAYDIENIGDLIALTKLDLLRFRTMGKKSIATIKRILENVGLELK